MPHCLMWCIWHERNAKSFGGYEHSMLEIKSFYLQTLLEWSVCGCHIFLVFSLPILLDRCNFGS